MWWQWVVGVLAAWVVLAGAAAFVIGRAIRLADRRSSGTGVPLTTADLPDTFVARPPAPRVRRRTVPLPAVGVALAATAVLLETCALVVDLTGTSGPVARLLSMNAPMSLPRLFVALLFAAAALAALAGARPGTGRRTWWSAVAVVSAVIAWAEAAGPASVMHRAETAAGRPAAAGSSALLAVVVLGGLWFLSRTERRDRRRVLGALCGYAVAAVAGAALPAVVSGAWSATVLFLAQSCAALGGVALFVAVLVGVAPRLVLPASWPLRRTADLAEAEPLALRGVRPAGGRVPPPR